MLLIDFNSRNILVCIYVYFMFVFSNYKKKKYSCNLLEYLICFVKRIN